VQLSAISKPGVPAAVLLAALSCSSTDDTAGRGGRERPIDVQPAGPATAADEGSARIPSGPAGEEAGAPVLIPRGLPVRARRTPACDVPLSASRPRQADGTADRQTGDPADDPVMAEVARATGAQFACVDEGPYRVIVEGTPARASSVVARTIRPVREALAKQYFEKGPRPVVRLILFMRDDTYRAGAEALSGEEPDTPFGYYSSHLRAVIMNLATGGGTLVHEMVHTFVEEDFPDCPAWLNEGLGSLYEQCSVKPDRLVGLTNWRLPALREALASDERRGPARPGVLARLVGTTSDEFYAEDSGLHYAVARYLCYDLQERGLLERFYRQYRADVTKAAAEGDLPAEVASGRRALERALGETLDRYEFGWRARTMDLEFR
jgi:hypothetical protein